MKLYFYFLEEDGIRQEECEVIEKPKTYYPSAEFPKGFVGCFIRKEDIGKVAHYYRNEYYIILLEKDNKKVTEIFNKLCNKRIESYKDDIAYASKKIAENEKLIKIIDEWKNN